MIYLKSIYSEPNGLFKNVEFHDGINIIYGRYSKDANKKDSLNSIGKSTLVNLINFCLLSSFDSRNPLFKAKKFVDSFHIVLEIEINKKPYIIKRSTKNSDKVILSENDGEAEIYNIETAKQILCSSFFYNNEYRGIYSNKWFRQLIPLFIRNEKTGFVKSPILYIDKCSELKLVPFNLFLLGIDNKLAMNNYEMKTDLKSKKKTQDEIKKIIEDNYNITDIKDINVRIGNLKEEIDYLENSINKYELGKTYEDREKEADKLTKEIKKYAKNNYSNQVKLEKYRDNLRLEINISVDKIERMYKEIDEELGVKIRKTLDEAIEFKKRLVESRTTFLKSEIENLVEIISENNKKISEFDIECSKILNYLQDNGAIKDLTDAISALNSKKEIVGELSGKLKLYNDLESKILTKKKEESSLNIDIKEFINSIPIQEQIYQIRRVFNKIYNALYKDAGEGIFNIS